jgi:hypothetical protein
MCRKAHGAAFRSRAAVALKHFKWLCGEDLVRWYESSPGDQRGFCAVCGSTLPTRFDRSPDWLGMPLGGLDEPAIQFVCHVFVGSKATWDEITDTLPRYVGLPDF